MTEQSRSKNTTAGVSTFRKTDTGHNVPADHTNVDNRNKNINTTDIKKNIKLRPPPIQYDPDAIFGGDFDEDPYDYSEDEEELHTHHHACLTPGPGYDPGPCAPRPLSQDQPTTAGLRAWNESRGLFFWGRTSLTLLSEVDITPLYPLFTPSSLLTIDRHTTETKKKKPWWNSFFQWTEVSFDLSSMARFHWEWVSKLLILIFSTPKTSIFFLIGWGESWEKISYWE